jgi:hypothetical protein
LPDFKVQGEKIDFLKVEEEKWTSSEPHVHDARVELDARAARGRRSNFMGRVRNGSTELGVAKKMLYLGQDETSGIVVLSK